MDLIRLRSELQRLSEIVGGWNAPEEISALERDLVLEKLRGLYDAVRFGGVADAQLAEEPAPEAAFPIDLGEVLSLDPAAGAAAVPDDGLLVPPTEVTVLEGDTAFTLLERVCAERGLALDVQRGLSGVYVQGIGGVREFDCGALSGWLFRINGEIRSTDSGSVVLQDGDVLEFLYTCELGADIR